MMRKQALKNFQKVLLLCADSGVFGQGLATKNCKKWAIFADCHFEKLSKHSKMTLYQKGEKAQTGIKCISLG